MIRNKDMEYSAGQMEMCLKEPIKTTSEMDSVVCFGVMEVITRVNGKMDCNMEKERYSHLDRE